MTRLVDGGRGYLDHDLWAADATGLAPARRVGTQLLRLVVVAVRASRDGALNLRAMGLVYSTLLSLVPLLAVTFSVLKAFGAQDQIRPLLEHALSPLGAQRDEIADRIIQFVSNTLVGVLGAIGVAGLLYTVLSLMDRVEDALNHVWHARHARGFARKFTDYFRILIAGPVLIFAAFALIASAQSHWVVRWVLDATRLAALVLLLTGYVVPVLLLAVAFFLLYGLVPNTEVSTMAALTGAGVAAVLSSLAGAAFAEVGYFHQYPRSYIEARVRHGALYREWLALAVVGEMTRRFLAGEPPGRLLRLHT